MSEYIFNRETQKIELHFDKAEYMALSTEQKAEIKSNFLFSRYASAWVSRAKFPHLYRAEEIAKKIGLQNGGKIGEALSFEEQQERKAERAERRAERMEARAERAIDRGRELQTPIDRMHGDIAFFTQPNINTSAGRAFTRRRNRMFEAWEKGFAEFRKSDYYKERAAVARQTAADTRPTDKAFCQRRIDDAQKTIRAQEKYLAGYREALQRIENGETMRRYNGEIITADEYNEWIERAEAIMEQAIDKAVYYQSCIDDLGGVEFSKENVRPGYTVKLHKYGEIVKVVSSGPKNITYRILSDGAAGMVLKSSYAEIAEIVSTEVDETPAHPFKEGDVYTIKEWDGNSYAPKTYKVTKITADKVTVKSGSDRAKTLRPRKGVGNSCNDWYLSIADGRDGYICKRA